MKVYIILAVLVLVVIAVAFFALKKDWSPSLEGYTGSPEGDVNPFNGVSFNPLIGQVGTIYNQLGQQI